MRIPYGISNFTELRRRRLVYVDKTPFIPVLEDESRGRFYQILLRPRRFGKTLLISMLEQYYDVLAQERFDEQFAGLAISRAPTAERGGYLILRLEFTQIATDRGPEQIRVDFATNLETALLQFCRRYQKLVPELSAVGEFLSVPREPAVALGRCLSLLQGGPYRVYVFIDEYDNFTNTLIARGDHEVYRDIVQGAGFVREFYKALKQATATGTVGRILMTGVSPVTLDDLTSGFNIAKNISQSEDVGALCGFTAQEVDALVTEALAAGGYTLDRERLHSDLQYYYDGYGFSPEARERIYNPDMVLHFLSELRPPDRYPRQLLDMNVRTDYGRIQRMVLTPEGLPRPGAVEIVQTAVSEGRFSTLPHESFSLDRAYEGEYLLSLFYYLGLLTLRAGEDGVMGMAIPNYVIRQLGWEILGGLLRDVAKVSVPDLELERASAELARSGDVRPFLRLVHGQVIRRLSNRDLIRMTEKTMKAILLAYLTVGKRFDVVSEMEVGGGYSDLVLMPSKANPGARYCVVLELKYMKAGAGQKAVAGALAEAEEQLSRYTADPRFSQLAAAEAPAKLRSYAVAFAGNRRCYLREAGGATEEMSG